MAIAIAKATQTTAIRIFVACKETVSTVKNLAIVEKERAGQNTHVSSLAITFPAFSGKISYFLRINPTKIHKKSINIGDKVAKKVSSIIKPRKSKFQDKYIAKQIKCQIFKSDKIKIAKI